MTFSATLERVHAHYVSCCVALLALLGSEALLAQTTPDVSEIERPQSAIFIGNSFFYYNNGMQGQVRRLVTASGSAQGLRTTLVAISGSGLKWHDVDSYFRPGAIGEYSFRNNDIVFNDFDRLFDVAILMDCSQCPLHPQLKDTFWEYAEKHSATVRSHGAQPVFFMTWAYADRPEMIEQLAEQYTRAGNANSALVIPAGLAFARSIEQRPDLNLYNADRRHPSALGTYLAACTVYASLTGQSPIGLDYTAGIDTETAAFLQAIAWETVKAYFEP